MNWLTTIAFAVLLLSVQYDAAESRSPTLSRSPWANPAQASSLMNCLIAKIAGSNVLPQQEKEDLESIMDTLMSAIKGASAKGKSSGAQLQAINMAVASSLAELVVAEDAGNQASIAVKTQALSGALGQCFQAVMGTIDRKFISEINDLISMFAREAASESNEIPDEGLSFAAGSSATSSFQASSQTFQGSSQTAGGISTYPGGAYPGAQVSQPAPIGYTGGVASYGSGTQFGSLSQTSGFTSSAGSQGGIGPISGTQSGLISRVANALANTSTMRTVLRSSVTQRTVTTIVQRTIQTLARTLGLDGNNLSTLALQAISQVPEGSDTSAYTQALSTALITSGVLNESNIDTLGSQVLSAVLNGVSNAAQGLGMNVDTSSLRSDISSSSSSLSTSSSSASFSQTSGTSTSGFQGGYPVGPQVSQPAVTGPFGGGPGFGQTTGSNAALISRVANTLASSSTLRTILSRNVSQQTASNLVQRAIQTFSSSLGVDGNNLSRVALQAISQVPSGSDTSAYAQAISTALINAGVLNASNIDTSGSQILSAVLNGFSSAAQGLGLNTDISSTRSDISSSSSLSASSTSASFSQTAGTASTSGFSGGYPVGPQVSQPAGAGPFGGGPGFGQTTGANAGLISRVANALANSSTLRTLLSSNVSQQTASNLVQRAIQTFAGSLGVDGNNLSRVALQAISQVPAGSDTSAYTRAFSTALFNAGVLNSSNFDTSGSQVISAVLNGFSNAAQGLGLNFDTSRVQSDISSSSSFLSTSTSSTSFSQTAGATSTSGFPGGYPVGPQVSQPGPIGVGPQVSQPGPLGGFGPFAGQGGLGAAGAGQSAGVSIRSTLNSPNGLKSGAAAARISQLTSSIGNAITPYGVDANGLASSLQASFSTLQSSGMSSSDAKIEVLLETIVGLLQLLSNTQIRGVNMASASSVTNSATRSFELALA